MRRILRVHPSGFHVLLKKPLSVRAMQDELLLKLIQSSLIASGGTTVAP